jgi:hypothetical protein
MLGLARHGIAARRIGGAWDRFIAADVLPVVRAEYVEAYRAQAGRARWN